MISGISMASHWTKLTTGQADIPVIKEWYLTHWLKGFKRALEIPNKLTTEQVFDIFHNDLSLEKQRFDSYLSRFNLT